MKNKILLLTGAISCAVPNIINAKSPKTTNKGDKPNIIIILTDDQGYGDVGCFGAKFPTPNIDRMADQGMKLTDFYAGAAVSTPSRAALLTGCYPKRVDLPAVLFPSNHKGLNPNEMTIAELLKQSNYTTCCVGKWHLGHHKPALPLQHGFDEFFGLPYSNDMRPKIYPGLHVPIEEGIPIYPDLPLIKGNDPIEYNPDQTQLTTRYTEYAVDFIDRNHDQPFFLYLAHSMPHVPLAVSDKFKGKSGAGLYGDVIMEIDWSIGQIYDALRRNGIEENTWVIYTSDNGPWLLCGDWGGSAGPLREGKGTAFEGGERVFCLMTWPKVIPAGVTCNQLASSIDLLPTIANYVGGTLPQHIIDGKDIFPLISNQEGAVTPHDAFYFYGGRLARAIRCGNWKFVADHTYKHVTVPGVGPNKGSAEQISTGRLLFDLSKDISEQHNLIDQYPEIANELERKLLEFDKELTANIRKSAIY